jgi:hypothetical protein
MPISAALLFCIPIGIAFYFEARWLIRWATRRCDLKERRLAIAFGVLGALLIPVAYSACLAQSALSERLEKTIAVGIIVAVAGCIAGFAGCAFVSDQKEAK